MADNNNFNRDIKYFYTVRESVHSYSSAMKKLYMSLNRISYKAIMNAKADWRLTAFVDTDYLKNQIRATKDNKDYRVKNLLKSELLQAKKRINNKFEVANCLSFGFKNAYCMHDFIKDMGFRKDEILYSGWMDNKKIYTFLIKFDKGIPLNKLKAFKNICGKMQYYSKRYGVWGIDTRIFIPSSIKDRWYDAFAKKTIWDIKPVLQHISRAKTVTLDELYERFNPYIKRINKYNVNRSSNFINNNIKVDTKRANTYIVNHFLDNYNPYKRTNARKDWKYAAECFMNEFLGKINYARNNDKEFIQISKSEITLFLRSLKLNTKIDANTFKRTMLRFLLEMHFVETDFIYKPKIECRKYKFLLSYISQVIKTILYRLSRIKFMKFIYMQKNDWFNNFVEKVISNHSEQLSYVYMGPPRRT